MIYHSTSYQEAGSRTTEDERTLLQEYMNPTPVKDVDEITTYLFPDDSVVFGSEENRLLSKWSVLKTLDLHHQTDMYLQRRQERGLKVFKKEQRSFEMGIKLNVLINLMSQVYGVHNWFTEIGRSELVEVVTKEEGDVEKMVISTLVTVTLADNTSVAKVGMGYSYGLNKEMSFKKAKKESVTEGLKLCISELIILLYDYEEKVKIGYYDKYK